VKLKPLPPTSACSIPAANPCTFAELHHTSPDLSPLVSIILDRGGLEEFLLTSFLGLGLDVGVRDI
jgi:hypothetical protein